MIGYEEMNYNSGYKMGVCRGNYEWRNGNQHNESNNRRTQAGGSTQKYSEESGKRKKIEIEGIENQRSLQRKLGLQNARVQ